MVPVWKRNRAKYSNYLPLDAISTRTATFRQRAQSALVDFLLPSGWRAAFNRNRHTVNAQDGSDSEWDDEGEELFDIDDNRREALSLDARRGRDDVGRRLSRDLEEGFKDDSEDEDDTIPDRRSRSVTR